MTTSGNTAPLAPTIEPDYNFLFEHNNELYTTIAGLEHIGISKDTIDMQMRRNRAGDLKTWQHDYTILGSRKPLILIAALPKETATKFHEVFTNDYEVLKLRARAAHTAALHLNEKDIEFFMDVESHRKNASNKLTSSQAINPFAQTAKQRALGAAWLRIAVEVEDDTTMPKTAKTPIFEAICRAWRQDNIPYPNCTSVIILKRYIKKWQNVGYPGILGELINGRMSNPNARKNKDDDTAALIDKALISWYSDAGSKMTFAQVHDAYLRVGAECGWQVVSEEWIRARLNEPRMMRLWFTARNGKKAYADNLEAIARRVKPSFPDALWSIDGTTIQLVDNGIKAAMYAVWVYDVFSNSIVGCAIGRTENAKLVEAALYDAMQHGNKPYQLEYDKGSANMATTIQALMTRLSRVHFPHRAYNARAKWAEGFIGRFESLLSGLPNFKGSNITCSRDLRRKANSDFMKQKLADFPDQEGVLKQLQKAIGVWNYTTGKDGRTPLQRYSDPHEARIKLPVFDVLSLFATTRKDTVTYAQQGILTQIEKQNVCYWVADPNGETDFLFRNDWAGFKFKIAITDFDRRVCYLYDDKDNYVAMATVRPEYAACVADKQLRPELPSHTAFVALRDANNTAIAALLAEIKHEVQNATGHAELGFDFIHKDALNAWQDAESVKDYAPTPLPQRHTQEIEYIEIPTTIPTTIPIVTEITPTVTPSGSGVRKFTLRLPGDNATGRALD